MSYTVTLYCVTSTPSLNSVCGWVLSPAVCSISVSPKVLYTLGDSSFFPSPRRAATCSLSLWLNFNVLRRHCTSFPLPHWSPTMNLISAILCESVGVHAPAMIVLHWLTWQVQSATQILAIEGGGSFLGRVFSNYSTQQCHIMGFSVGH